MVLLLPLLLLEGKMKLPNQRIHPITELSYFVLLFCGGDEGGCEEEEEEDDDEEEEDGEVDEGCCLMLSSTDMSFARVSSLSQPLSFKRLTDTLSSSLTLAIFW